MLLTVDSAGNLAGGLDVGSADRGPWQGTVSLEGEEALSVPGLFFSPGPAGVLPVFTSSAWQPLPLPSRWSLCLGNPTLGGGKLLPIHFSLISEVTTSVYLGDLFYPR